MNLGWQLGAPDCPCLVSTCRPWLLHRFRDLTGAEALEIQGFPAMLLKHGDKRLRNPDLLSMAGNAMSGYVLIPLFLGIFSNATWAISASNVFHSEAQLEERMVLSQVEPDDSENASDSEQDSLGDDSSELEMLDDF